MIATILESLRRPAASSQDFRTKLAEIDAALPEAEAALRAAEQRRAAGLLSLPDRDLERIEAEMARALRDRDRLRAARDEAERRLADAEAGEVRAVLDAERAAVEARAAKLASRLRPEYEAAGAKIVALLTELAAVEEEVRALNRRLADAGRHADAVPAVETRVIDFGVNSETVASLLALTSLRPLGSMPGYGSGRTIAANFGLKG